MALVYSVPFFEPIYGRFQSVSRDSSVSLVTRLQAGRPGFESRVGQGFFYFRHRVLTGFGVHVAS